MRYLVFTLSLILLPNALFAKESVYLTGMRIQPSMTMTRIIFKFTGNTSGRVKYYPEKDRVIIDFVNTRKQFNLQNVQLKNSNIKTMTTIETKDGTLQFILTVQGKVNWKIQIVSEAKAVQMQFDLISVNPPKIETPKPNKTETQSVTENNNTLQVVEDGISTIIDKLTDEANQNKVAQDKVAEVKWQPIPVEKKMRIYTIVIDAGHGGKDPGAIGQHGTEEKYVVLNIAKKLAEKINRDPNMHAVLTRRDDSFVPLRERIKLARKGNADVFIAIHADAYFDNSAKGASIFALSKRGATSEAARWLAKRENYSELGSVELDSLKDRSPLLRSVLIDLAQTATIRDSILLGNKVLDALDDISSLHHNYVEQAPFVVLKSPDIPSILIETGFITNPHEEKRLANPEYQEKIAHALALGIREYVKKYASVDA